MQTHSWVNYNWFPPKFMINAQVHISPFWGREKKKERKEKICSVNTMVYSMTTTVSNKWCVILYMLWVFLDLINFF